MGKSKKVLSLLIMLAMVASFFGGLTIPSSALSGNASFYPAESNLSIKYWVTTTASSNQDMASLAVDEDFETAWIADPDDSQPSITVDLGGAYDAVRKTQVVFASNKAVYKYKIEGSTDGQAWYTLADRTGNTIMAGGFTDIFSQQGTRYIRLTVTGGKPVGVREFKVINYLRDNMKNGSDMSEQGSNTNAYYYNADNNPPMPGFRGGRFSDEGSIENGNNIFGLANDFGWKIVRLRVWNEPKNENNGNPSTGPGNCSPENTLRVAKAIVGAGMELAIDFHYSDSWADPQNQPKPYAWAELPFDELVDATYNFTYQMIKDLTEQGTPPSVVAIGNEITNGMMWGKEYDHIKGVDHHHYYNSGRHLHEWGGGIIWKWWHEDEVSPEEYQQYLDSHQRLARLVDAGIRGVRRVEQENEVDIDVEIHCAFNVVEGQEKIPLPEREKFPRVMEFINQLTSRLSALGSTIDRIGISYYPDWHGSWAELQRNLVEIHKVLPDVDLNISECSPKYSGTVGSGWDVDPNHPDGFVRSVQTQGDDTIELLKIINDVPDNKGQGIWSWAGTNVYFTGWGNNGTARASMKAYLDAYATSVVESDIYVTTYEGIAPVLPSTVKNLDTASGEITDAAVTWDEYAPSLYNKEGSFTVNGIAASTGNMNKVTAIVTVLEDESFSDDIARIDFNDDWKFHLATRTPTVAGGSGGSGFADYGLADAGEYTTEQIIEPDFDDSSWRIVSVPHDFSIEGEKVSNSSSSQGYLQGGLGYYRKTFVLPESMEGQKRIAVDFEGVYQNSIVYVNGQMVGNYPSGYTGFTYDITDYVNFGADNPNVIVVKVQNMSPSGRWYTGSGIIRPVTLVVTGLTRFVRNGVVITAPTLEQDYKADGSAHMSINARAYSDDSNGVVALKTTVYDADGNVVITKTSDYVESNPSTAIEISDEMVVPDVRLWSMEDPYRYTIQTDLLYIRHGGDGTVQTVDSVTNKFGFRWFRIDNDEGFFLNDKYAKLQGVDLHHDSGALGAAGTYDAYKRQMLILKSMGVNAYRSSHNPPSKAMIDVCSELGIVVMEEAYDGWGSAKATYDFGRFFLKEIPSNWAGSLTPIPEHTLWSDWVIREMVARDINEPCIIMWSIGNEVRGVGSRPSWYNWRDYLRDGDPEPGSYGSNTFNEYTETLRLRNNILDLDTSRYITIGGDQQRSVPGDTSVWHYINYALDGFGLNYNTAESVDGLYAKYKNTAFFYESESSSQTGARGKYLSPNLPNSGINQTPGKRGTSGYDNNFASWTMPNEYGLKKDRDRKFFLGQFIWSGFDYIGEPTPYNVYPVGVSSFGCIDTAGFFKDSYYLYKSQWTSEPMAHIVPMNWNDWRPGEIVEVWVNTNAVKAELFLNGRSLGVKSFDVKETTFGKTYYETTEPTQDNRLNNSDVNKGGYVSPNGSYGKLHLTWYVPYEPGELKAVAMDADGNVVATDVLKTAGQAYTINMKADKSVIKADGRSLVYIECDIVDEDGVMLPSADNLVKFDVEGGFIVGVDNGQQESTELYKWGNVEKNRHSERSAFNGKVLCIVQSEKGYTGEITLTASSDNMVSSTIKVLATEDGTGSYTPVCEFANLGQPVSADTVEFDLQAGNAPALPVDVKVNYDSGFSLVKKVTWEEIDGSLFAVPGSFEIEGTVDGTDIKVIAYVNVSEASAEVVDIALNTEAGPQDTYSETGAIATASFTNGTSYPNRMIDGDSGTSWTNKYRQGQTVVIREIRESHAYETVEVYWPNPQAMNTINLYFVLGGNRPSTNLPKSVNVQYWNGFEWIDTANQQVTWQEGSNRATEITFDRVMTSRIRVGMENATPWSTVSGAFEISQFSVFDVPRVQKVATPTASVESGTYSSALVVELSCATEGAEIYYTTDGSTPTVTDEVYTKLYTNPIIIDTDTTLKAIAVKEGMEDSDVAEYNYIIEYISPMVTLTADSVVEPDSDFTVTVKLEGSIEDIYAEDITISFDDQVFDFVEIESEPGVIIANEPKAVNGTIRIIAANEGGITGTAPIFNIVFHSAGTPTSEPSAITVTNAKLGSPMPLPVGSVITADGGSVSVAIQATYIPVESIIIDQGASINMKVGETATLTATIEPADATNKAVTWSSSNTDVATVDSTGKVTAVSAGTAIITARSQDNTEIKDSCTVTVSLSGDLNNDGVINVGDLAIAAYYYNAKAGDENWDEAKIADINGDGKVDIIDLAAISISIL